MGLRKKWNRKRIILTAALGAALLLAAVYIGFMIFFSSHFWFRTTVNGVDCSLKNVSVVEELITSEIDVYQISLEERGGRTERIKSSEIGLKPVFDGTLQKELKKQKSFLWITSLFGKSDIQVETMVDYDEAKLADVTDDLNCMQKGAAEAPKDAYLSAYQKEKGYEIVPEVEGNKLNRKKVDKLLKESILNLQERVSFEENGCYAAPKRRADDRDLVKLKEQMNRYAGASVTYEYGSKSVTLDGGTISTWLSADKNLQAVLDEEKAAAYVKELASRYDTAYQAKALKTSYGSTVTISKGDYGWQLDQEGERAQLLSEIREGQSVTREPLYKQRAASFGANDYGDTYVEINLTAQHLFFYKDGSLLVESDFVSGNLSKGYDTPSGAYGITYTQRDAVLKGEDYRTPVDYWMPFNGGVGMHDADWRSDFGGNYYKTGGSHGCINLPPDVARKIFENIKTNDPVLVYELPGTESEKANAQDAASPVISAISAIGDVTLNSGILISDARSKYDALPEGARAYVKNYDTLVNAETAYANLVAEQQNQAAAQQAGAVTAAIDGIGEVTADKRGAIEAARASYNALSDQAKSLVGNYDKLTAAEQALAGL